MAGIRPTTKTGRAGILHPCVGGCGRMAPFTTRGQTHWRCDTCAVIGKKMANRKYLERMFPTAQAYSLYSNHRMTVAEYDALLASQGGVCAGCGIPPGQSLLHVDHDHSVGCHPKNGTCARCRRGLLCGNCNRAMGLAQDDPAILRALAGYLERHGQ